MIFKSPKGKDATKSEKLRKRQIKQKIEYKDIINRYDFLKRVYYRDIQNDFNGNKIKKIVKHLVDNETNEDFNDYNFHSNRGTVNANKKYYKQNYKHLKNKKDIYKHALTEEIKCFKDCRIRKNYRKYLSTRTLLLAIDVKSNLKTIVSDVTKLIDELQLENQFVTKVVINFDNYELNNASYLIDDKDIKYLLELEKCLEEKNVKLSFSEFAGSSSDAGTSWNLEQVIKANSFIDDLVKTIKENDLSPIEATIYTLIWERKNLSYDDLQNDCEKANTLMSAVINKKVMCVGFSDFLQAVLMKLQPFYNTSKYKLSNVKKEGNITGKEPEKFQGENIYNCNHCQVSVYIKDKKYNKKGKYILDGNASVPTGLYFIFDNNRAFIPRFGSFLIPSELREYIDEYNLVVAKNNFSDIINDYQEEGEVKINCIPYKTYMDENKKYTEKFIKEEGEMLTGEEFSQVYIKILPLVFPELKKGDIIVSKKGIEDNEYPSGELQICKEEEKQKWKEEYNLTF